MIKNVKLADYGLEGTARFELFDKDIDLLMDENIDMEYAEKCVQALNDLKDEIVTKLCEYSIKYHDDFNNNIGKEKPKFDDLSDVLKMINPKCLVIEKPNEKNEVIIHLEMNCDWETEHGLEWIIREKEILYVGAFESEYPNEDISYYKNLAYNYVFN